METSTNDQEHADRPVIDMDELLRAKFMSGKGVVCLTANMPDTVLLLTIKHAASFGKPFTVIPAEPFVFVDGKSNNDVGVWMPGAAPPTTLNLLDQGGTPEEVLSLLARIADVQPTPQERETALAVLRSLPAGAGIRHFIDAFNAETARRLGISVEMFEALVPFLVALETFAKPGLYGRWFGAQQ